MEINTCSNYYYTAYCLYPSIPFSFEKVENAAGGIANIIEKVAHAKDIEFSLRLQKHFHVHCNGDKKIDHESDRTVANWKQRIERAK